MAESVLQWLGPNARLTLWRVTSDPFTAHLLGHIQDDGETWSAWLAPSETHAEPHKLRTLDDREAAGKTLCARLRVGMPALPGLADSEEL